MDTKILQALSKKMKEDEVVVDLIPISILANQQRRSDNTLAVTTVCFYFMDGTHLRRTLGVQEIKVITLSTFSQEIILHCLDEDIRMTSKHNVKIIKNILKIRQHVFKNTAALTVLLEKQKSLAQFVQDQGKSKHFWGRMFGKKGTQEKGKNQLADRNSYCQLEVTERNFVLEIGRQMYRCIYSNVQLLYMSGSLGFILNQFDYIKEQIDEKTYILKQKEGQQCIIMRKLIKADAESTGKMRRYIENFKLQDSKEQIYYALETVNHFQIILPCVVGQRNMQELLCEDTQISNIDLVTIFYKLMNMIKGQLQLMHSLSPREILVSHGVTISYLFCLNSAETNANYIAPEQLDPSLSLCTDPQLTNFWKIGMLLYEIAFSCLPFPVEYLAVTIKYKLKFEINFPDSKRSRSFKNFILQILQIQPSKRGGGLGWRKNIFDHIWIRESMK